MTKTLSMDIRGRFRRYIEEGWTARAAGRALKISPASAVRFRQMILQGKALVAKPRGRRRDGGKLGQLADVSVIVPCDETARIQEAHIFIGHWLCEVLDQQLAPEQS